jgi:primosomal protein N'
MLNLNCKQCGREHSRLDVRCPNCGKQATDSLRPEAARVEQVTPEEKPWLRQLREAQAEDLVGQIPPEKLGVFVLTRGILKALDR